MPDSSNFYSLARSSDAFIEINEFLISYLQNVQKALHFLSKGTMVDHKASASGLTVRS